MNQCKTSHVFLSLARGADSALESRIQLKESGNIVPLTMISGSSTWHPESTARGPEYQSVLDCITWGNTRKYLLVDSERYSDRVLTDYRPTVDRYVDLGTAHSVDCESVERCLKIKYTWPDFLWIVTWLRISSIDSKVGSTFILQLNETGHHRKFLLSNLWSRCFMITGFNPQTQKLDPS